MHVFDSIVCTQLISDLHLVESDVKRLPSVSFTYCNDIGTATGIPSFDTVVHNSA